MRPQEPGDPDEVLFASAEPWALQLVLFDPRPLPAQELPANERPANERPTHLAACEAVATATVRLLDDERSAPDGPWHRRVARWDGGPIRKVVRRARGARWKATQALPHVEVRHRGAAVRAFVPAPVDHVPQVLAKLQVGGTDLPELGSPAPPVPGGLTVAVSPVHPLTTGKAAAQCAHAAHLAWRSLDVGAFRRWRATGFAVRVVDPDADAWAWAVRSAFVLVRDAGHTEVPAGTVTALAWPPSPAP